LAGVSRDVRDAPGALPPFNGISGRPNDGLSGISSGVSSGRKGFLVDYTELLRRLALHDEKVAAEILGGADTRSTGLDATLDPKTLALVRLAALVAVGGAGPSYGAQADAAFDAGSTAAEIADVLVGVIPVVGLPRVVAAAPKLALALGHDVDDVLGT
jgi:4-carboxymuconolactone decarboxylase